MSPLFWEGQRVLVTPLRQDPIEVGDCVVYWSDVQQWFVLHRVVSVSQQNDRRVIVTKGDALPYQDPPIDDNHLLGRVYTTDLLFRRSLPKLRSGLTIREEEGGGLLYDVATADLKVLNRAGFVVCRCLTQGMAPADIVVELAKSFPGVSAERLVGDLDAFLSKMSERGLVQWEDVGC